VLRSARPCLRNVALRRAAECSLQHSTVPGSHASGVSLPFLAPQSCCCYCCCWRRHYAAHRPAITHLPPVCRSLRILRVCRSMLVLAPMLGLLHVRCGGCGGAHAVVPLVFQAVSPPMLSGGPPIAASPIMARGRRRSLLRLVVVSCNVSCSDPSTTTRQGSSSDRYLPR
jgi:hypothetical protein